MKLFSKKCIAILMIAAITVTAVFSGGGKEEEASSAKGGVASGNVPKYIFLFIGDGLSFPQIQLTSAYLSALDKPSSYSSRTKSDEELVEGGQYLPFMNFPSVGTVTTYDSTSFAPDSSSTATSMATGYKTHSGVLNMDETKTKSYTAISEILKAEKDYKVGIVSSVNVNHATPAAFYAHQPSRGNYYEIGLELVASEFDYFAGGAPLLPTGKEKDQENIYDLAAAAGYKVVTTPREMEVLTKADGKVWVVDNSVVISGTMNYENDRSDDKSALKDYVAKGIELLDNETGFFMMVESGKIDWACHANDAGSAIGDTLAFSESIDLAIEFYNKHPEDTLILVTGDHETGGLTLGYAGTQYDLFLNNLENQKISFEKFDKDYANLYKSAQTPFATAMVDVEENFGLVMPKNVAMASAQELVLTDYEVERLEEAYNRLLAGNVDPSQMDDYLDYAGYNPFTVTITQILNNKSGIDFTSYSHTGLPVPLFAQGAGAENFDGFYDNTNINHKLMELLDLN